MLPTESTVVSPTWLVGALVETSRTGDIGIVCVRTLLLEMEEGSGPTATLAIVGTSTWGDLAVTVLLVRATCRTIRPVVLHDANGVELATHLVGKEMLDVSNMARSGDLARIPVGHAPDGRVLVLADTDLFELRIVTPFPGVAPVDTGATPTMIHEQVVAIVLDPVETEPVGNIGGAVADCKTTTGTAIGIATSGVWTLCGVALVCFVSCIYLSVCPGLQKEKQR